MKTVISFVVGAAVGSAASYFIFKKKFQADADAQIKEVRENDARIIAELSEDNNFLRDVRKKASENYNKPFEPIAKSVEGNNEVDYHAISAKKNKVPKVNITEDIKSITEPEYFDRINNKEFVEKAFTFYQGDNSLVDEESGLIVSEPDDILGTGGVDAISKIDVEEVYYSDDINKIVNCIIISEDSYYGSDVNDD